MRIKIFGIFSSKKQALLRRFGEIGEQGTWFLIKKMSKQRYWKARWLLAGWARFGKRWGGQLAGTVGVGS